ncbi:MAG: hypothetical protein HC848_00245 [Limnobacter sp.]|nr:hypothetical protein [Limnobacter sp.]
MIEDSSYDDCILNSVASAPNESAVELVRESCLRKFTIVKEIPLKVTHSLNSQSKITISNPSDYIVTQVAVDAGDLGEWEQSEWIEPHGWIDTDAPDASLEFVKAAKGGKVEAMSLRVIEVDASAKSD